MGGVTAFGPIAFNFGGKQYEIPLSQLFFDDTGAIKADLWAPYTTGTTDFQNAVGAWLRYLAKTDVLTKAAKSAAPPAMLITAASAGAAGNSITITIANVKETSPGSGSFVFDATVAETDQHKGLTKDNIRDRLGTPTSTGSEPGLVFVWTTPATLDVPKAGTYAASGANAEFTIDKNSGTGTAFKLRAKAGTNADQLLTSVVITDPDSNGVFDLTATWSKSATGINAAGFAAAGAFDYDITVADAPGQTALGTPAAGTYKLSGGAEKSDAVPAKAILPGRS